MKAIKRRMGPYGSKRRGGSAKKGTKKVKKNKKGKK